MLKNIINYFKKNNIRLRGLKNIHKGDRAFVIGSGPSLLISDLKKLENEITFACNKIYLSFSEIDWRPTYYSVIDTIVAENNAETINKLKLNKIFSNSVKKYFKYSNDINWLTDIPTPVINGRRNYSFSRNIARGTYGGHTVIYTLLQIAFYMGIREIYLLGLDFCFENSKQTGEKTAAGEILLRNENELNHFHPDYRKAGELWTMPHLDIQYEAFKTAKKAFEEAGGCIYNASRKTELDVFPLVEIESVLSLP